MGIFKPAQSTSAYLKAGFMGFAGGGKTMTASLLTIAVVRHAKQLGLPYANRPVFFLDTETGSDYVKPVFDHFGIQLQTAKTRAFADLVPGLKEAEAEGSALIIDSISHYWKEFLEAYQRKKNRAIRFDDWAYLKEQWGRFTDAYVNSSLHICMNGRAGYEYDFFTDDETNKRELQKTGVKMRTESETGFEPSLLVLMERSVDAGTKQVRRVAHILKERFNLIDGASFEFPATRDNDEAARRVWHSFAPHIRALNLGGQQMGVDSSRSSEGMIPDAPKAEWQHEKTQRAIYLEKVDNLFAEHGYTANSKEGRAYRITALREHFGTDSWTELEGFKAERIKDGYNKLHLQLNGAPAFGLPAEVEQ